MLIKCRAKISPNCFDGRECRPVYGEDSIADDGLFNGESVICDPCYIAGGQPALDPSEVGSREALLRYVDREMGIDHE